MLLAYGENPSFFLVGRQLGVHHQTVQRCVERALAYGVLRAPVSGCPPFPSPIKTISGLMLISTFWIGPRKSFFPGTPAQSDATQRMTCVQNSEVPSGDGLGTGLIGTARAAGSTTTGGGSATGVSGTGLVLFMSLQSPRLAVVPPNQLGGAREIPRGHRRTDPGVWLKVSAAPAPARKPGLTLCLRQRAGVAVHDGRLRPTRRLCLRISS
jgi:hypothetical protein